MNLRGLYPREISMMDDLAVNVASPFDLDSRVGAQWFVIHASYPFICIK